MDYGYYIVREIDAIQVFVDPDDTKKGYLVLPKDKDEWGKYDINEVLQYVKEHPEKQLVEKPYVPTKEERAEQIRVMRTQKIFDIRWRVERYQDAVTMGITPPEPIEPILEYIQALRDITKQEGFPFQVEWPKEP